MYGFLRQKGHLPWIIVVVKDATSSVSIILFGIIVVYPNCARASGDFRVLRRICHLPWIIVVVKDATSSVSIILFGIIVIYPYCTRGSGVFRDLLGAAPIKYLVAAFKVTPDATKCWLWVLKRLISAAGCCVPLKRNWVTALKSPKRWETPVAPKAVDKAVQVAALVAAMRSRMFREHLSSMAPLAIESHRVHLASSAGSVGAVVVLLTMSQ